MGDKQAFDVETTWFGATLQPVSVQNSTVAQKKEEKEKRKRRKKKANPRILAPWPRRHTRAQAAPA